MSQIAHRANLSSDDIPLLSAFMGQTVLIGKYDQDYELSTNPNNTQRLQKEKQTPQAYYAHNVMPTGKGYQSVGYTQKIAGLVGTTDFQRAFVLRDPSENKTLYSPSGGRNYFFDRNAGVWKTVSSFAGFENALVTIAYLNGETYIYYQKLGCFKYNKTTQTLDAVVLVSLVANQINGICASNGFLLAWDDTNTVYRSQANSPLDFTPDPALGSGSSIPQDIRGKIVVLLPITNGFIVYTTANAVAGIFQQNIRYPFIFREVEGSSGILSPDHVSWTDNLGEHFVWSKSGLTKLNKSKAEPYYPEITDFLVAKIFEDYDSATDSLNITKLTSQLSVKITLIGSRFLVVSYGVDPSLFTHAVVHDLAYKRYGKLKIDHVDCFNYAVPNLSGEITWAMLDGLSWADLGATTWLDFFTNGVKTAETPKEILAFIDVDGTVKIVNFDIAHTGDDGVIIFGKYQLAREKMITLDGLGFENADPAANFTVKVWNSLDGKNITNKIVPFNSISAGYFREYMCNITGVNQSVLALGTFNLVSLELAFHAHSRR